MTSRPLDGSAYSGPCSPAYVRTYAATSPLRPGSDVGFAVEVRRSKRRKRTVAAYIDGDTIVVMIPARMTRAEERTWVDTMVARLTKAERRRRPSDTELMVRARELSNRYLDARARPTSVRWVTNQQRRWGSCTPADGTIRLSTRLQGMPAYVVDYVLLHELTHLLCPGHGDDFWAWLARFELTERARGFLDGVATAERLPSMPGSPADEAEWTLDGLAALDDE